MDRSRRHKVSIARVENVAFAVPKIAHCSDHNQVIRVANAIFRGQDGLLLLRIESERLSSPVVYENLDGGLRSRADGAHDSCAADEDRRVAR